MTTALIDLVRHGATTLTGRLLGRTDPPLSDIGWQQFRSATAGKTWTSVVASPLARAREAAERFATEQEIDFSVDPDWAELDFGAWDGVEIAGLQAEPSSRAMIAELYRNPDAPGPPGGEGWRALEARVSAALHAIVTAGHAGPILVSTHGGPIRAALSVTAGLAYPSLWSFRIEHGTRVRLATGRTDAGVLWGEIVEIAQP